MRQRRIARSAVADVSGGMRPVSRVVSGEVVSRGATDGEGPEVARGEVAQAVASSNVTMVTR